MEAQAGIDGRVFCLLSVSLAGIGPAACRRAARALACNYCCVYMYVDERRLASKFDANGGGTLPRGKHMGQMGVDRAEQGDWTGSWKLA